METKVSEPNLEPVLKLGAEVGDSGGAGVGGRD